MMTPVVSYLLALAAVLVCFGPGTNAQEGIGLTLNNVQYTNNSVVNIMDIGTGSAALHCTSTLDPGCCFSFPPPGTHWYFPNGTRVDRINTLPYYRSRIDANLSPEPGAVILHRNPEGTTTGIFRCEILDATGTFQSIYVGIYTAITGNVTIPDEITFRLDADPATDPPVFTLTCTSTGGPPTTVSWRRDGTLLSDNSTYNITSQALTDAETATYNHTLTVTGRLVGGYQCSVSNTRTPSGSSRSLTVGVPDSPTGLSATQVNSTSIRVSWTAPVSGATVTGYRISYSGGTNQDSVDAAASATNHTITIPQPQSPLTYSISIISFSSQLPSPMAGPIMVTVELLHNITIMSSGVPISGETYNLTCTVEANVLPTVHWLYSNNGTEVTNGSGITVGTQRTTGSNTTILTLSFNPLVTSHGRQYTCQSTTRTPPSTVNATRNVTVQELLHNITIMSSGVPISGETYNLTCTVESNVPPTVHWLYSSNDTEVTNGSNITVWTQRTNGSTTILTLSFNPLHTSHGGQYTCQSTTDTPPSTVTATRNVTVQELQHNITILSSGVPISGETYNLTCIVDANIPPTVQWLYTSNGTRVTNGSNITVGTKRTTGSTTTLTLSFNPLHTSHGGQYTCRSTTDTPSSTVNATRNVTVQELLHNITIMSSGVPVTGETYNLTCTVESNVPQTVQWLHSSNGIAVTNSSDIAVGTKRPNGSATTLTLSFNPLHTSHGGQYTCRSTTDTPLSTVNATRNVTVQELLHTITIMSSGVPITRETYNLICTVESNVPPTVHWLYSNNGTAVTNGSGITVGTQRTTGSTTILTLSFNPLHISHGRQYTCQSTTRTPPSTVNATRNVTLQEFQHNITITTSSGEPISGETYNLTCTVESNVPQTVQWLYTSDGTTVTNGSNITVGTQRTNGSTTILTLSFDPLHTSHGRQYTCLSTTDTPLSTVNATRNVTVQVTTPSVTITQDPTRTLYIGENVTLECLIRLDNTVDSSVTVTVVWSASDGVAITNTSHYTVSPVTGSFPTYNATLHLYNLVMNDSGGYTCNATVSPDPPSPFIVSSERQSELLSITIVPLPRPSAPTITMAVSQFPTSINLTWTQPEREVVDSYEVSFSYQGPCSGFSHTNTTTMNGTTRQHTLTGLQEFSNYTVTVVAINSAGRSEESSENVVTMPNAPGDPPAEVTATATSPVSILIRWGHVSCIHRNSIIRRYTVRYSTGGGSTVTVSVSGTGQTERTYTATSLLPNTSYSIQVAAVTNTGVTGPFSTTVTETTSPPQSVLVLNGAIVPNHGFILLDNIGETSNSLLCLTDNTMCCGRAQVPGYGILGDWYNPDGTLVLNMADGLDFYRNRGQSVVRLHRRGGGESGIYRCVIPDTAGVNQTMYTGVYTADAGDVVVSSVQFQLTSDLNATSQTFTLTCNSTGGPATTVSWTVNNSAVTEDRTHSITSQILTSAMTATYNHTLSVTGRLVGEYKCNVSNNKPSSASGMLAVVAADSPTNLTVEQLPQKPGSFRVLWIPPASSANLTEYRIYYSGPDDSGSVDVGAPATEVIIDNCMAGVTYSITMVALSPHLPSPVVGPVSVILGALDVTINRDDGAPTAGQSYNLTCTVILNGITGSPNIEWLGQNNNPVSNNSNFTVENVMMVNNSVYERTLVFSRLHTSHGENYYCRGVLDQASAMTSTELSVQIPPPSVSVTNSSGTYAGTNFNLTCTIELSTAVDTPVVINSTWCGPLGVPTGTRVVASAQTILMFRPLNTSDSGNYTCEVTVSPSPESQFINASTAGRDTLSVTVQALPRPEVTITPDGSTTAGDVYTLTCNAGVVENLFVEPDMPDIQWLYANGTTVGGTNVGTTRMTGNVFTRNLTFCPLHTSDGRQYTCRTSITISAISLSGISRESSINVTVRIPINATITRMPPADMLSAGINLNLTCTIWLNTAVDTDVMVNTSWTGPNAMFASNSRISITDLSESVTPYKTTLFFSPLNVTDSGTYTCQADVRPNPSSLFIMMNRDAATHTIIVENLVAPVVMITSEGEPTAGNTYTLVCRVSVVEGVVVDPNPSVMWLSSERTVSGLNITVGGPSIEGSVVTRNLTFNFLHTSNGGEYTCRASISVSSISIANITKSTSTNITVKIPQPTVSITPNRTGDLYAGTPLTLTCSIQLNSAVDTTVMVNRMWSGPGSQAVRNSRHVTMSNPVERSAFHYETTIQFHPLSTSDGVNYECKATIIPDPQSQFVTMSTTGSDTHPVTVQDLPGPEVIIHGTGNTTAGEMYTLSCTAIVVENLVVVPHIQWEYSNGSAVDGGPTFTLSDMTTSGNKTTRNLTFSPLRTSHGGEYTCRAIINISSISISGLNGSQFSRVVIQIPVPTIDLDTMQPTINGTNVTLTCTITLDTAVDTAVNVSVAWLKSNDVLTTSNTTCITVSDIQTTKHLTYQTFLQFEPLGNNSRNGDRYVCEATVIPFLKPQYIRNISTSNSFFIRVGALPLANVQFTPSTFAMTGQSYSLTCTAQVVQYLATPPVVTWLAPDGSSLQSRNGITVEQQERDGNITTLLFTIDQLAQSHTGNYTCQACISIDKVAIQGHCRHVIAEVTLLVPGRVQNLESRSISDQSVSVLWGEPVNTNGAIVNYTVQVRRYQPVSGSSRELELVTINPEFNRNISTATLTLSSDGRSMIVISEGLEPLVPYNVTVVAVNLAGPGEPETMNFFTREGAPSIAPGNVEVIRLNGTAMNVSWVPLNLVEARGFVQSYIITYQQSSSGTRRRRQVQTQRVDGSASYAIVGGLQPGVAYNVTVSGMTTQTGPVSSPTRVQPERSGGIGPAIAGVVAALVVALIVIIIVMVVAYFLYNSRHKGGVSIKTKEMYEMTGKSKPEKSGSIRPLMSSIRNKKDEAPDENQADGAVEGSPPIPVLSTEVTDRMKPISVISFRDHVQQMHAERDRGFEIEYQSLGSDPLASHEVAKLPFNRAKNRFANIFPYDYCRVKLNELPGEEGSDYINASIMDGYNRKGAYIAAQGPMPNSISDFWRMIWEKRLPNIVMLTKCMEAGRRKCEQYWGENIGDDFETPDNKLRITTTSVMPLADFDIRIFTVKSIKNPDAEPLRVTQYHFTSWPDHGVPKFATSLTAFIRRVQKGHNKDDGYPLLVHCSAGVGRTGTFILLDSMLERMKAEDTVNVYEFLHNMRTKRVLMVQTQPQYIFIHDALDELITCGETDIPAAGLRVKVNRLRKIVPGKGITGFAEQFQLLDQVSRQPEEGDFSDAQEHYNREKNRYPDKLPYNMSRARLRPTAEDGSEYINASFVDGYKHRNAYIATQAPLQTTVKDFWRMIWEFKSKSIVMLCNMMEDNQETSYPYWPTKEEETIKYGKIIVMMQSKAAYGDFIVRKFNLQEDKSQGSPTEGFQVTQFHHTEWPETGKPPAAGGLIEMIDLLMKTQMNTGNRAITVMCNDGVGRTGTFICIHSQLERLKTEGVVDIFQSIKSARIQRAGLVPEADQYAFCHEVLADYVDKFENYANFKDVV